MPASLQKVALVTGGARRVGRAIALELAGRGYALAVHYRHASAADVADTLVACREQGIQANAFQADLAEPAQIAALFASIQAQFGRLDGPPASDGGQ